MKLLAGALCICGIFRVLDGANILLVFPIPTMSHHIIGEELAKALIKNGHHTTIITPFHVKDKPTNYDEVILDEIIEWKEKSLRKLTNFNTTIFDMIKSSLQVHKISSLTLENAAVRTLLQSNKTFDAVLIDPLLTEALHGFSYFYKAPTIIVSTTGSMYITNKMVGNSYPFAYVPNIWLPFTDEMSFLERTGNTFLSLLTEIIYNFVVLPEQDKILHDNFPDAPPVWKLNENISLLLQNAHYSVVETPRPYMPNMIQIGGIHIQPQSLPKDLKDYLDTASDGVILFSLGSNFKTADLPKDKIDIILRSFAKFPQKFLWKFENDDLVVPSNVKVSKWLPQRGILEHPNVKAFITHGGLLSVTEAIYYAVPFIGVPAFADQPYNIHIAVHRKIAIKFSMNNLNEEDFVGAIKEILENRQYKENILRYSSLFRDQPVLPNDLAVHWIEHVVKYKGATHLQSAGLKLTWIRANLLDVIGFIVIAIGIVVYLNFVICRIFLQFVCKRLFGKKKLKTN